MVKKVPMVAPLVQPKILPSTSGNPLTIRRSAEAGDAGASIETGEASVQRRGATRNLNILGVTAPQHARFIAEGERRPLGWPIGHAETAVCAFPSLLTPPPCRAPRARSNAPDGCSPYVPPKAGRMHRSRLGSTGRTPKDLLSATETRWPRPWPAAPSN